MRWIVHIGSPKTGSTAIQRFLFDNREALPAYGIHYPDVSLRGYGHHDLAFLLNGGYPEWATQQTRSLDDLSADLRTRVRNGGAGTVVLSSENFYLYPRPSELASLMRSAGWSGDDEVNVVCYVRRQDEAHISWYNQTVKAQGNSSGFDATVRRSRDLWDYAARLEPWRREFGDAAIVVRDYAPFGRAAGDVRLDVCKIAGIPCDAFPLPAARVNERINRDIVDFQRFVNKLPLTTVQKRRYHNRLIELTRASSNRGIFDDSPYLTDRQRAALVESYARSNAVVATTWLGRDELFEPVEMNGDAGAASVRRGLGPVKIARILQGILGRDVRRQ